MSLQQCIAAAMACLAFQPVFLDYFAEDIVRERTVNRVSDAEDGAAGEGEPPPADDPPPRDSGNGVARRPEEITMRVPRWEVARAAWLARPEWARRQAINTLRVDASKREAEARAAATRDLPMLAEAEAERAATTRILIAFLEELDGRNRR